MREYLKNDLKSKVPGFWLGLFNLARIVLLALPFWVAALLMKLNSLPMLVTWLIATVFYWYFIGKIIHYYAMKAGLEPTGDYFD